MRGRVLRVSGLMHLVRVEDELYRCELRGRLKAGRRATTAPVYVGDWVQVACTGVLTGVIESVEPRTSTFSRGASEAGGREQVIAVNLEQLIVVAAVHEPEVHPGFIDRALIMAARGHMRPLVCVNKTDLAHGPELAELTASYADLGYTVLCTSAVTGAGVGGLSGTLAGRTSALVGQSGVGKSALLNSIDPDLRLRTQELMRQHDRGRHTTSAAQLHELAGGGWVADTPGIKELSLWGMDRTGLASYFIEMQPLLGSCRFRDCSHLHEPGCAIRDAVRAGVIAPRRYAGYTRIMEGL
jgi:ribosome biogenesis GTPase